MKKLNLFFLYLAIFVISSSVLMVEIISTRVSKIAFGYNFQFVILSFALVGLGVGGIIIFFKWEKIRRKLNKNLLIFSLLYIILLLVPFLIAHFVNIFPNILVKTLFFTSSFFVYTLAGIILASIFREYSKDISQIYATSFIGSAFGAITAILLLQIFGTQISILFILLFSSIAILAFSYFNRNYLKIFSLFVVLAIFLLVIPFQSFSASSLTIKCDQREILLSDSNSFSQIDAFQINPKILAKEASLNYNWQNLSTKADIYRMYIDCIGITTAIEYSKPQNIEFITFDISNFPFMVKNYTNALIVGSGAGIDVVRADFSGVQNITGVEINPIIVDLTDKLVDPKENVYYKDNVNLVISEARSFIADSDNEYDLIYLSSSKRYGGSGVASYALLENYLFTEEAFETYFNHLTPDGILALADLNWFIQRDVETGILTLLNLGVDDLTDHIFILEGEFSSVVIFQKQKFSDADKENLIINSNFLGFTPKFLGEEDINYYLTDSVPVTDDHPFYWSGYTLESIINPNKIKYLEYLTQKNQMFLTLEYLFILFFSTLVVYLAAVFIPFNIKKINSQNVPNLLIYFSGIGAGFIILELTLIQKFTLFLGNPLYSISVVLSSILFFGGIGSLFSKKISVKNYTNAIKIATFLLAGLLLLFLVLSDYIFESLSSFNIITRGVIAIVALAFPSFLLGVFLPLGIKITERISKDLIPWMWSIDAITTVLGGVMSTIIALLFGFKAAIIFGILFYVIAFLAVCKIRKNL